jgi:hypothetical protein
MAEVWEGYDTVLSRPVAIKMLLAHLASDETVLERFRREAITAASLAHPGVIATYDTGLDEGTAYIVMELVRGRTLRHLMSQEGPLDPGLAVRIAGQITDALAHAHRAGLVHRDIKPANVLLCDDDGPVPRTKVTDFGIAKAAEGLGLDLTQTGIVLGTPKYLSPEQVEGLEPDSRADLYSLGVVLFEMLAGRPPFVGATDMATALSHLRDEPPRVASLRPSTPPELDAVVAGLLVKDREERRPSTALSLRRELATLSRHIEVRSGCGDPRPTPGGAIAGGVGRTGQWGQRAQTPPGSTWGPPAVAPRHANGHRPARDPATGPDPVPAGPVPGERAGETGTVEERAATRHPPPAARPPAADAGPRPAAEQRRRRSAPTRPHRAPGVVVACLVVAGVVVVGLLLGHSRSGSAPASSPPRVVGVSELLPASHSEDNPSQLPRLYDGDPSRGWSSDQYPNPSFGGLYPGLGLVVQLDGTHRLSSLTVTGASRGWSARVYVATSRPAGNSVSAWGPPVASVANGSSTTRFALGERSGGWVLLWLTQLSSTPLAGGGYGVTIGELSVG